jgi:hypothetical protein
MRRLARDRAGTKVDICRKTLQLHKQGGKRTGGSGGVGYHQARWGHMPKDCKGVAIDQLIIRFVIELLFVADSVYIA